MVARRWSHGEKWYAYARSIALSPVTLSRAAISILQVIENGLHSRRKARYVIAPIPGIPTVSWIGSVHAELVAEVNGEHFVSYAKLFYARRSIRPLTGVFPVFPENQNCTSADRRRIYRADIAPMTNHFRRFIDRQDRLARTVIRQYSYHARASAKRV